jgi:alkanesulfonate monooxygenase SsuD/methylene tetrahydromethanopterin reductase-like flavin-dependent oxidoreductase (luciferase family)
MHSDIAAQYLDEVRRQFRGHKRLAEGAIAQLKDEDLFKTLDSGSNSIAILIKHMAGNMRSRFTDFVTTDGEKPDRDRDQEFEMNSATTRADVMRWWEEGWSRVFAAIDALQPEDVMRTVTIRGEPHTVLQAINRQIAHYAQHTGQIVFLAKHFRSSEWKTLSIPRGKSKEFKAVGQKYERGVFRDGPEAR